MFAQQKVTLPKGRHKIIILDEADRYRVFLLVSAPQKYSTEFRLALKDRAPIASILIFLLASQKLFVVNNCLFSSCLKGLLSQGHFKLQRRWRLSEWST